jgi:Ca2+-binding EF-hand superfamily protein
MSFAYKTLVAPVALALLGGVSLDRNTLAQPPGMSFGGGGPPMMIMGGGSDRGGDRGGDRGRGGFSGGGFSGGFGGGGFDPSSFISRMDTNGNGSIDPEEAQGPARFMLDRMARNNPKIDLTKPIPISVITESFQQMRSGGSFGGGSWGGGSWGGETSDESVAGASSGSLVPGFGVKIDRVPVPGFGASGKTPPTKVEDQDLRDADERMRRYDRNNDGGIDESEYRETRWNEQMSQWDSNKDGKLTREEVAVRYARRRLMNANQTTPEQSRNGWEARNRGDGRGDPQAAAAQAGRTEGDPKVAHPFEKQASFRTSDSSGNAPRPSGMPEWFVRDDTNLDNQVSMGEFARKWDASTLEDFYKFDINQDGFITVQECLAAVKKGYLKGSGSSSSIASSDGSASPGAPASNPSGNASAPGAGASGTPSSSSAVPMSAPIDERMRVFAKRSIDRADKDKNGFLTPDEFKSTRSSFGDVDKDKNGKIDLDEYVQFSNSR